MNRPGGFVYLLSLVDIFDLGNVFEWSYLIVSTAILLLIIWAGQKYNNKVIEQAKELCRTKSPIPATIVEKESMCGGKSYSIVFTNGADEESLLEP